MKIKDVICEVYKWEMPTPANVTTEYPYPYGEIPLDILRIITDDGTEGLFLRPDVSLSESNVNDMELPATSYIPARGMGMRLLNFVVQSGKRLATIIN